MSWPCARLEDLIDRNKAAIALTRIGRQGRRRLLKNNKKKRRGVDSQNTKSTRSDRAVGVTHSRDRSRRVRGRASGAPSFFVWLTLQVPSCQRTRFVECRPSKGFARTWFGGRRGPCVAVVFIQLGISNRLVPSISVAPPAAVLRKAALTAVWARRTLRIHVCTEPYKFACRAVEEQA